MTQLSDGTIRSIPNLITPFVDCQLQPASYDLLLGEWQGPDVLEPGEFRLASTVETVKIPDDLSGSLRGKSSVARLGLIVEAAGFVDPGFEGQLTLELYNMGNKAFVFRRNMPICQIAFFPLDKPAERPYGCETLGSHYQGQTGPTPSWMR